MTSRTIGALCAIFFSCLIINVQAADPPFPTMAQIMVEFYQTEVQVTNLDQQITALATEYFDNSVPRGKVEITAVGNKMAVFTRNDTQEIFEVNSTTCTAFDTSDDTDGDTTLSEYEYSPLFYGWLNRKPLVIGPSAPLWMAQDYADKITYLGERQVRDINCEAWSLDILKTRDNVTFTYYFANKTWVTPYSVDGLRVPVRIEVRGVSSAESEKDDQWQAINQYTDFAYFRPSITDWRALQPPEGLGCMDRAKKSTLTMPDIPKVFSYYAEVYDVIAAEQHAESDIDYQQVWYDYERQIARLDKYTRLMTSSEIYDFNTGVTYSIHNDQTCTIQPLRNSWFETYFTHAIVGHFKDPKEVLELDGDFYYMGKKLIRGIWSDVFESVDYDVIYNQDVYVKFVVTVYFTQENYQVAVNGEDETRIPVFMQYRGYNTTDTVALNVQYNIFGFDDVIYPELYESFQLARCFPSMQDKSYFILMLNVQPNLAAIMEGQDEVIMELLRRQISTYAKVAEMRIPFLKADYKTSGVYVTGLLLDRPPALKQFWLEFEGDTTTRDNYLAPALEADTKEKCALACVAEDDFQCLGFYFCNEACYMKSKDILEDSTDEKIWELGKCQTYVRAERNSLGMEPYLVDAIKNLEKAVLAQEVKIAVTVDQETEAIVPVTEIVIGDGPYTGDGNQEKPYDVVVTFGKLKEKDLTTTSVDYATTLNECYRSCKEADSVACASFSYCPTANNKQCRISSRLVLDRKQNPDDTEDDKNCYVYSLKYLDMFTAYPGRSVLVSGEDVHKAVKSAEECGRLCRQEKRFSCRGFEYCRSAQTCVLHSKHVLDLKPGEIADSKKSTCTHYAARFTADYYDKGLTVIQDDTNQRSELTLEECARACSEELKSDCKSFTFCAQSGPYMTDSTCSLSKQTLADKNVKTGTKDRCRLYEKKETVDDWAKKKAVASGDSSGYTSKSFTGLVIAMLALGLVLGAIGFVIFSYYKSKSQGEGMTVRFMKSDI